MDSLLVIKLLLLAYILVSAFISHTWVSFVNATPIKILILLGIVCLSFVDFQLAILAMIAFLVLLVNLNKTDILKLKQLSVRSESSSIPSTRIVQIPQETPMKEQMIRGQSIYPMPSDIYKVDEHFSEEHVKETIYDFPSPYCNVKEFERTEISDSVYSHNIDYRTKPYEEFVRKLSPEDSLKLIQSNEV